MNKFYLPRNLNRYIPERIDSDELYIVSDDNGNYLLCIGPYLRDLYNYSKKDEAYNELLNSVSYINRNYLRCYVEALFYSDEDDMHIDLKLNQTDEYNVENLKNAAK